MIKLLILRGSEGSGYYFLCGIWEKLPKLEKLIHEYYRIFLIFHLLGICINIPKTKAQWRYGFCTGMI